MKIRVRIAWHKFFRICIDPSSSRPLVVVPFSIGITRSYWRRGYMVSQFSFLPNF
jgi:hypothetical protein